MAGRQKELQQLRGQRREAGSLQRAVAASLQAALARLRKLCRQVVRRAAAIQKGMEEVEQQKPQTGALSSLAADRVVLGVCEPFRLPMSSQDMTLLTLIAAKAHCNALDVPPEALVLPVRQAADIT